MTLVSSRRQLLRGARRTAGGLFAMAAVTAPPALAFDPVPYAPPKIGLEVHYRMTTAGGGKTVGTAIHKITGTDGNEVTFSAKSEQILSSRTFSFDNLIVSQYGIAPKRMSGGKSATIAKANWSALDGLWPLAEGKQVFLNFEVFRATLKSIGSAKPYLRGRSSFSVLRAEKVRVLDAEHDAVVLERKTYDEILAAKKPIKREVTYHLWWSLQTHWVVRMEISGRHKGQPYKQIVTVTKLVQP